MDLAQYRRELKAFYSAREKYRLEKYLDSSSLTKSAEEIEERYSDLFSPAAISDLEKSTENYDELTATEITARRNLLNISRLGFLKNQAKEITAEYDSCRKSARIFFQNESLTLTQALMKIRTEDDATLRREIHQRISEARNSCSDLFLEKFKILRENAAKIGFENYSQVFENIAEIDFKIFTGKAEKFLAETEEKYFRLWSEIFLETKSLGIADFYFRQNQSEREEFFSGKSISNFYRRLLENFGFRAEKISNVKLAEISGAKMKTDFFRPNFTAPEVFFAVSAGRSGIAAFSEFLKVFGKVQQSAWTSASLTERFPEFIFSPDAVLSEAYGGLFQILLQDENFLRRNFGWGNEKLTGTISRENKFWLFFEIRRAALLFLFEAKFYLSQDAEIIREFAALFTQNLGFQIGEGDVLFQLSENFASLKFLRAAQFAFGFREYFQSRYDFDWWNRRASFEELIDFWNTAERYKAEEMARSVGFEMNFDLLKEI